MHYGNSLSSAYYSQYILTNDASNQLNITSYDESKKTMTGNFNLTFVRSAADNGGTPDKIVFSYGAFKAQINHMPLYIY